MNPVDTSHSHGGGKSEEMELGEGRGSRREHEPC